MHVDPQMFTGRLCTLQVQLGIGCLWLIAPDIFGHPCFLLQCAKQAQGADLCRINHSSD